VQDGSSGSDITGARNHAGKQFFFRFFFYLAADRDLVNPNRHAHLEAEAAAEHAQVRGQLAREGGNSGRIRLIPAAAN
jgi:hypothetical protein